MRLVASFYDYIRTYCIVRSCLNFIYSCMHVKLPKFNFAASWPADPVVGVERGVNVKGDRPKLGSVVGHFSREQEQGMLTCQCILDVHVAIAIFLVHRSPQIYFPASGFFQLTLCSHEFFR